MAFSSSSSGLTFAAAPSSSSFGIVSDVDPYETHFARFDHESRKPINLPGGYVAKSVWLVSKESQNDSPDAIALANKGSNMWKPKGSGQGVEFPQRCPFISVDNLTFFYTRGMSEPSLCLGLFSKPNVSIHGTIVPLYEGLVIAAGGHYERASDKKMPPYNHYKVEAGDMSLDQAGRKEMNEEIGIERMSKIVSRPLAFVDDPTSEPRAHYLKTIFLRWVKQQPKASAELKTVFTVPVSQLRALIDRKAWYTAPDGKRLGFILKHDQLLELIMALPDTQAFLANIITAEDAVAVGAAAGGVRVHTWALS